MSEFIKVFSCTWQKFKCVDVLIISILYCRDHLKSVELVNIGKVQGCHIVMNEKTKYFKLIFI